MTLGNILRIVVNLVKMTIIMSFAASAPPVSALAQKGSVKNIVIVHGAFADGSGWEGVFHILSKRGYKVTIVQNPLTSLEDDVAATIRALDRQDGPVILVGHSYGGTVITQAGVASKVKALVYVAAFVPDVGENTLNLVPSRISAQDNGTLSPDENGFIYYDKSKFRSGFAAEQREKKAAFMFASQQPLAAKALMTPLIAAAWKTKPSYGIVATEDKIIDPGLQRNMYLKARAKIFEVRGSHTVYMSNPKAVAKVIEEAASCSGKRSLIKRIFKKNNCD
jgi:pimeloyl-ACP methyl ester carboxylesterase